MARTQISLFDRFNTWRTKSNEQFAQVGDLGTLVATKTVSFVNPTYFQPDFFTGTPASFTITKLDVYTISILDAGEGYSVGEEILIKGSELGGVEGIHDCTVTIDTIGANGEIGDTTVTGTPQAELILEVNQVRDELGTAGTLTTTAQTIYGAVNELDDVQGNVTEWGTVATTLTGAVKEIKAEIGSVTANDLGTDATTIVTAINEIAGEVGDLTQISTADGVDLGDDLVSAVNALKGQTDDLQAELGGDMADNYVGENTTVIAALNYLYNSSDAATLEQVYVKRDGGANMLTNAQFNISNSGMGVTTKGTAMVLKTWNADQNAQVSRISIADSTGNVGIGTDPSVSYRVNVDGKLKATNLYYGTQDTDNRYLKIDSSTQGQISSNLNLSGNVGVNPADTNGDITADRTFQVHGEVIADSATGAEFTVSDFIRNKVTAFLTSTDITFTAQTDENGVDTLALTVDDDSHNHLVSNIDGLQEYIEDTVGGMIGGIVGETVTSSQQSGITVSYGDNGTGQGFLNFDVDDFTIDIGRTAQERTDGEQGDAGDIVGSFTITDLGSVEDIALTVRDEKIRDVAASILTQGTGISIVVDDDANTATFSNTDLGSSQNIVKNLKFKTQEEGSITYFDVRPVSALTGTGCAVNITRTGDTQAATYSFQLVSGGTDYSNQETLTIPGTDLGGASPANDLELTVTGLNNNTEVANLLMVNPNTAASFVSDDIGTVTAGNNNDTVTFLESDGIDIGVDATNKKVTFNVVREYVEDVVGAMFDDDYMTGITTQYVDTQTSPTSNRGKISLTATGLDAGSIALTGDITGSLAQASTGNGYVILTTLNTGAVGVDEIRGFNEQVRDVVKDYIDVGTNNGLTKNVIDALDEKFFALDGDDIQNVDQSVGVGAGVTISKVNQSYQIAKEYAGSGYQVGERFTIKGTELDGVDSVNDCVVEVKTVDAAGAITAFEAAVGVAAITTNTVDKLSLAVDATPTVTIGDGDTVTVANTHISGVGNAGGNAFGLKIKSGVVTNDMLAGSINQGKLAGSIPRSKTTAAATLNIIDSGGTTRKTIIGWAS